MEETYDLVQGEVIADSEGEEDMGSFVSIQNKQDTDTHTDTSNILTYASSTSKLKKSSAIDDFSSSGPVAKRDRPKPRPKSKKLAQLMESSKDFPANSLIHEEIDHLTPSIADRAKMRSRASKASHSIQQSTDVIELSSEDEFNLLPTTKSRKRKAPSKSKAGQDAAHFDEISFKEPPSKRRASTKQFDRPHVQSTRLPASALPSSSSNATDPSMPIPFNLLPPQTIPRNELPPIAVLPNSDLPSSYPTSLFGSTQPPRNAKPSQRDSLVDELEYDDPLDCVQDNDTLPVSIEPPSTFFAATSSPPIAADLDTPSSRGHTKEVRREEANSSLNGDDRKRSKRASKRKGLEVVIVKQPKKTKSETTKAYKRSEIELPESDLSSIPDSDPEENVDALQHGCINDSFDITQPTSNKRHKGPRKRATVLGDEDNCRDGKVQGVPSKKPCNVGSGELAPASPKENRPPQKQLDEVPTAPIKKVGTPQYSNSSKIKATPMSELIRRVNSLPGSVFHSPKPRTLSGISTAYSPLLKSSRSALSRIAPLHPNRRTPPPPLPPPPPRKKTKKELEMEEKWEEELIEMAGGTTEWACMTDAERAELRKAKRQREMAGWED